MTINDEQLPRNVKRWLHAGDVCIALIFVGPMGVIHWRGTWALMDRRMDLFSPWRSTIGGIVLCTIIVLLRELFHTTFSSKRENRGLAERVGYVMFTKIYAYVFSMGCNMQWRGSWALLDNNFGKSICFKYITYSQKKCNGNICNFRHYIYDGYMCGGVLFDVARLSEKRAKSAHLSNGHFD